MNTTNTCLSSAAPKPPRAVLGVWALLGLSLVSACGSKAEPEATGTEGAHLSAASTLGEGYVHNVSRSKFRFGSTQSMKSEFGFDKIVGSEGVFATVAATGWAMGIPNALSPASVAPPYGGTASEHNQAVLMYFTNAGIPSDQVGRVDTSYRMVHLGRGATETVVRDGYISILRRAIQGVPVPDSNAWARFNGNGDVVEEEVYWPAISSTVIAQANALKLALADPAQAAMLLAKVPPGLLNAQVAIRHSPPTQTGSFEQFAVYDMVDPAQMGRTRHFDAGGAEVLRTIEQERVYAQSGQVGRK